MTFLRGQTLQSGFCFLQIVAQYPLFFVGKKMDHFYQAFVQIKNPKFFFIEDFSENKILIELFTFPSKIGYGFLKAIESIASAVDLPTPGKLI